MKQPDPTKDSERFAWYFGAVKGLRATLYLGSHLERIERTAELGELTLDQHRVVMDEAMTLQDEPEDKATDIQRVYSLKVEMDQKFAGDIA